MCSQWSSKQRIRLNLPISALYPHFSVLSPFQRFIPISAFYPHFSVLSPFQRFIPISAFYPHFSVLSPFQFPLSVSVSAIQFQRFIPTPPLVKISIKCSFSLLFLLTTIQQFASKHKPQTFSRVCLRLKRDVYRWKRNVSLLM